MRNRVWLILALAVVCGGLAAYLAFTFLRQPTGPSVARAAESTASVVVAARDMNVGEIVESEDVRLVEWPGGVVPAGYSTTPAEVVGRGLLTPVRTHEPLLSSKLASKEAGGGLPIVIPEGKRALSVKVDEVINVAGFATPGRRVDVLVTLDEYAQREQAATQVVLQNIEVLTAGQQTARDPEGEPQTVTVATLLVDPEQAEKLTLAANKGRIQLALRNTLDQDTVETPGALADELILARRQAPSRPRRAGPRRPSGVSVEVYRGAEKTTETVRNRDGGGDR